VLSLGAYRVQRLRAAIEDLQVTHGARYAGGEAFLTRLEELETRRNEGGEDAAWEAAFGRLQREALLANPLLGDLPGILLVRRRVNNPLNGNALGIPSPHECVSALPRGGWDNEIAVLSPPLPDGELKGLYRPAHGRFAGEMDLHWDGRRLLFTQSDAVNWKVWETDVGEASRPRQVSRMPDDVESHGACYTPGGRIIFGSTAPFQAVPCWHGQRPVSVLYSMNADGSEPRQLCFDQDHDYTPSILPNGQGVFLRWDYTGIAHIYLRQLMVMNPDGTGQRAIYGSNSWFPNSLFFPRAICAESTRLVCILSGYHGVHRMGQLVIADTAREWYEADGLVMRISGQGDPIVPKVRDDLVEDDWPKFLHPYPLDEKHFLVSALMGSKGTWGIYLADVFDNVVLIREEPGWALLEPIPLRERSMPPVIPDRADPSRTDGVVYLQDIYRGPGLEGVPRGTVKSLRVLAYHFAYPGLAGPDLVGRGGPWEVMRILGTVPLEEDGSAAFRVPADTPIAVQALDGEGKAVQLMRSWFSVRGGEVLSCVGCHESPAEAPGAVRSISAMRQPRDITPWRGPARGFDFAREVQPVLDAHCVSCHWGEGVAGPDLRPADQVEGYEGSLLSEMAINRMLPQMRQATQGRVRYTPAYEALIRYIRRVGVEDDVSLLRPGEYHADTSELVQMLKRGHQGVRLDAESWDRLVTWIDLNGPCHGTWSGVFPLPGLSERRMALRRLCGGPPEDPEVVVPMPPVMIEKRSPVPRARAGQVAAVGWPFEFEEAQRRQRRDGLVQKSVDMGDGMVMKLVRIPAGEFVMGDPDGQGDEHAQARIVVLEPFWMGAYEVTNEQFRKFAPNHDSGYYAKRHGPLGSGAADYVGPDGKGLDLNGDRQPAVRVAWTDAAAFCQWLSELTGMAFTLPTESQWEYACRAGSATALFFGGVDADYSAFANLADRSFSVGLQPGGRQSTGGIAHLVLEGADLADRRFSDGSVVTSVAGRYAPNAWGLFDMHGNAAEWTLSDYRAYPYREDGRNDGRVDTRKAVRGGSFFDRPARARSGVRMDYPAWQRVFNVGFRVAAPCEGEGKTAERRVGGREARL